MEEYTYNLHNFDYEIVNNNLIVKRKEVYVSKDELLRTNLSSSIILSAFSNTESFPLSYRGILKELLLKFTAKKLKELVIYRDRIKDGEIDYNGYYYIEKLNISYKDFLMNFNDNIKEILNLLNHLKINFELKIKLCDGKIIIYKNVLIS